MARPRLIFPLDVVVEAIDVASTAWDEDARTPIRSPKRTTYSFKAQVRFRALTEPSYSPEGLVEGIEGWLTVRPVDLSLVSYSPKNGDCITQIGSDTTIRYYLRNIQAAGHYPELDGAGLRRLYFESRRPADSLPSLTRSA